MLEILNPFRGTDTLALIIKLVLAVVLGGIIGIEREMKHRPAGFRTHILICLGASITTLTSIYLYVNLNLYTDIARLGASVIAGIGFVGAGAIIVTKNRRVKGLTTAAGFWVTAIIGLAVGAGYYEGAVATAILVVFAEILLSKIEYNMLHSGYNATVSIDYANPEALSSVITFFRESGIKIIDIEVSKKLSGEESVLNAILSLKLNKRTDKNAVIKRVNDIKDVIAAHDGTFIKEQE